MKARLILLIFLGLLMVVPFLIFSPIADDAAHVVTATASNPIISTSTAIYTATAKVEPVETKTKKSAQVTNGEIKISETPGVNVLVVNSPEEDLYQASLKFIAENPEDADEIARSINFIKGPYESASNMCGPLSIAILQEAGWISATIDPHDAWLLCMREREDCDGLNVIKQNFFPLQTYDYSFIGENVRYYDFIANPLQPGDFLYLFAGDTGFDHMLVVTRVDQDGAAYSVTNTDRGDGFLIKEELLYHPKRNEEGLFFEFTEQSRGKLGRTGNGGMVLIRRKGGLNSLPSLTTILDSTLIQGVNWNILVTEISSSQILYESYPNRKFVPASMIKIPMAMVTLKLLEEQGLNPSDFKLDGFGGRTFDQLFYAMVVNSEEGAAETLYDFIKLKGGERKILDAWNLNDTTFLPRRTSCFDLATLLEGLYNDRFLQPDMSAYLLNLMTIETENDSHYLGVIRSTSEKGVLHNKRGTLLSPTIVSDMGIYVIDEHAYILIISGTPKEDGSATFECIQSSLEKFSLTLGNLINNKINEESSLST